MEVKSKNNNSFGGCETKGDSDYVSAGVKANSDGVDSIQQVS